MLNSIVRKQAVKWIMLGIFRSAWRVLIKGLFSVLVWDHEFVPTFPRRGLSLPDDD
jgi:hypothetical protein